MGDSPPKKHLGRFGTAATGSRAGTSQRCQGHLPGRDCTWLNPTEMRQSLEPIQSSRESLLLSCPRTLCKAQETGLSELLPALLGMLRGRVLHQPEHVE